MSPLADGPTDPTLPESAGSVEAPVVAASDPVEAVPGEDDKRRYPSTIGGAFYLAILAMAIAGVVIVCTGHWRGGVHWLAGGLIAGALFRGVLPERDAGMLAVRNRWLDTALLLIFGGVLWFLATSLPSTT